MIIIIIHVSKFYFNSKTNSGSYCTEIQTHEKRTLLHIKNIIINSREIHIAVATS